jgi:hypothetical protein
LHRTLFVGGNGLGDEGLFSGTGDATDGADHDDDEDHPTFGSQAISGHGDGHEAEAEQDGFSLADFADDFACEDALDDG